MKGNFSQIDNIIIRASNISNCEFRIYCLLRSYKFTEEPVFTSQSSLAKILGVSISTINKGIKRLKDLKLIYSKRRALGLTNLYTFNTANNKRKDFSQIDNKIIREKELSNCGFRIYCLLKSHRESTRSIYPSQSSLANILGRTRGTINREIQKLKELGFISTEKRSFGASIRYSFPCDDFDTSTHCNSNKFYQSIDANSTNQLSSVDDTNNTKINNIKINNSDEDFSKKENKIKSLADILKAHPFLRLPRKS